MQMLAQERSGGVARTRVSLQAPAELASHYDLTVSQPQPNYPSFAAFECWLAEFAAEQGLSCAVIHDSVVQEAIQRLSLAISLHVLPRRCRMPAAIP
jgi:hypothetical protein